MKRILLSIILLICFLCGCSSLKRFEYYNILTKDELVYSMYPIKTYHNDMDDIYTIVFFENQNPLKGISFSADREVRNATDLDVISIYNIQDYIGHSLSDIENEFGKPQIDIGSGQSMPSYITEDGYLISFSVDNYTNVICHVGKTDLFTGESIEWYFAE